VRIAEGFREKATKRKLKKEEKSLNVEVYEVYEP
jgi:hypothetical protein